MPRFNPKLSKLEKYDQKFILKVVIGFLLSLFIIILLQIVGYWIQQEQIGREADTGVLVSSAGKQRMLSQRIALLSLALLNVQSPVVRDLTVKELLSNAAEMEKVQNSLVNGDPAQGINTEKSSTVSRIFFEEDNLDQKVRSFIDAARSLMVISTDKFSSQNPELFKLTEKSSELLTLFQKLTNQYQQEGLESLKQLQRLAFQVMLVITGTTLFIGLFIFYPLIRRLKVELFDRTQSQIELVEQNKELEQFAAIVAHDLKAPLNNIGGFSQFLRSKLQDQNDKEAGELLEFIDQGVFRMSKMISELLQYAKLTRKERSFVKVQLRDVVQKVLTDFTLLVKEQSAKIILGPMPQVWGDVVQLEHLFHNLIGNALKYKHEGRDPVIKIYSIEEERDDSTYAVILIEDNGKGIPQGMELKMFEPFRRLNGSDGVEGSGFGLALCRKIVKRHNGEIVAENIEAGGARFKVMIPAA